MTSHDSRGIQVNVALHIIEAIVLIFAMAVGYGQLIEKVEQMDKRHTAQMESLNQRLTRFEGYLDKGIVLDGVPTAKVGRP